MQREIKFRAWDGHTMFPVNVLAIAPVTWMCAEGRGVSLAYQPSVKVMQYTGLKDKKGVEIYEGDILHIEIENWHIKGNIIASANEMVEYRECCFGVIWGYHRDFIKLNGFTNTTFEVIGNIYANPELLKAGE